MRARFRVVMVALAFCACLPTPPNPPSSLTPPCPITPEIALPTAPYSAVDVHREGSVAFVTMARHALGTPEPFALRVYDLSPTPSMLGDTPLRSSWLAVSGTVAVVLGRTELDVLDLSDPASVQVVATLRTPPRLPSPSSGGTYGEDVAIVGRYAFAGVQEGGLDMGGLRIVDIADPRNPVVVGEVAFLGVPLRLRVADREAWITVRGTGGGNVIHIIDVSNPLLPAASALLRPDALSVDDVELISPDRALIALRIEASRSEVMEVDRATLAVLARHAVGAPTHRLLGRRADHIRRLTREDRTGPLGIPDPPARVHAIELSPASTTTSAADPPRLEGIPGGESAKRFGDEVLVAAGLRGVAIYQIAATAVVVAGGSNSCATCAAGGDYCPCQTDAACASGRSCEDSLCVPALCGDGRVAAPEVCDDGNTRALDTCAADCMSLGAICGDGIAQPGEVCDDGNRDPCAGTCNADCTGVMGGCGDGAACGPETCDDGNVVAGDGCSETCTLEPGWACVGSRCGRADCAGEPNDQFCTRIDSPDRTFDVCVHERCESPGCGTLDCNALAVAWPIPPPTGQPFSVRLSVPGQPVVEDAITGLQWHPYFGSDRTWTEAIDDCESRTWGGFDDWRLPAVAELHSIVDYGSTWPALDVAVFPDGAQRSYTWTSATYAGDTASAWTVSFIDGEVHPSAKTYRASALCVRSDRPSTQALAPRFRRRGDVVEDSRARLTWTATAVTRMLASASEHCAALELDGREDWRGATVKELRSIIDDSRSAVIPVFAGLDDAGRLLSAAMPFSSTYPTGLSVLTNLGNVVLNEGVGGESKILCVRPLP